MSTDFEDDETHAIPRMQVVDVEIATDKGFYYGLVIASPLKGNEYCQQRLLKKLDLYFGHIKLSRRSWEETKNQAMKARLEVAVHPDSSPAIFELLERCKPWAAENKVDFSVSTTLTKSQLN